MIFVSNQQEFETNCIQNKELDFKERANFKNNNTSPFSVALKIKDYKVDKIPFAKVEYHQDWMGENANIFSAKNSKLNLQEPSIFVVYPEIESSKFKTLADVETIPEEYAFARAFYKHPNGVQRITKMVITSINVDLNSNTIKAINGISNIEVKNGDRHLLELYFDNHVQGKIHDLRPELPLVVRL